MPSLIEFLQGLARPSRILFDTERMRLSSVLLLGCGAVGSFLVPLLVRALLGRLTLWDLDVVSVSNISRSSYDTRQLDHHKAVCLSEELKAINPALNVHAVEGDLLKASDDQLISLAVGHDVTVVAADNFSVHDRINTLLHDITNVVFTYVTDQGRMGEIVRTAPNAPGCIRCLVNFEQRLNAGVARDFHALGVDMLRVAMEAACTVLGILLQGTSGGERFAEYVNDQSRLLVVLSTHRSDFEEELPDGFVSGTLRVDTSDSWPECPVCQRPE